MAINAVRSTYARKAWKELSELLKGYALERSIATKMLTMAEHDNADDASSYREGSRKQLMHIADIKGRLVRLTSLYINPENGIDADLFCSQKKVLLTEKRDAEEAIKRLEGETTHGWLEQFKGWVNTASALAETVETGGRDDKKRLAVEIFGSNLFLGSKKARGKAVEPWSLIPKLSLPRTFVPAYRSARRFFRG